MKKYILLFIITLLVTSCTDKNTESITPNQKPVLLRVDAEHNDGEIIKSSIILVR